MVVFVLAWVRAMGDTRRMTQPLRLHYAPDNASLVIRLALEEMGVAYETVLVDRSVDAHRGAAYRRLHPGGVIPALETPQGIVFETAAILLWLADTYGMMAPAPDAPERGAFLKWLFFASNTLHADLRMLFYPEQYIGESEEDQAALRAGLIPRLRQHLGILDAATADGTAGFSVETPSVLGYYLACQLRWMALYPDGYDPGWFRLSDYPALAKMLTGLENRPATRAAQHAEGLGPNPFTAPVHPNPPEGSAI